MKRMIKATKSRVPAKQYVYDILEAMNWNTPTFCDKLKSGYKLKWGGLSSVEHAAKEIATDRLVEEYGSKIEVLQGVYLPYCNDESIKDEVYAKFDQYKKDALNDGSAKDSVMADIQEIYNKTGIQCKLSTSGNIVVPFAKGEGHEKDG